MKKRVLRKYDGHKLLWFRLALVFVAILVFMIAVFRLIIGVSTVSGHSMDTTLRDGQTVVFNRLKQYYDYGDIVYIRMASGEKYVKRVIGRPGDVIDIHDGKLFVNGKEETGDYINGKTNAVPSLVKYPLTLTDGQYFTVGDNRGVSVDSRFYGPVIKGQIRGVIFIK